jgi:hypothetical protein
MNSPVLRTSMLKSGQSTSVSFLLLTQTPLLLPFFDIYHSRNMARADLELVIFEEDDEEHEYMEKLKQNIARDIKIEEDKRRDCVIDIDSPNMLMVRQSVVQPTSRRNSKSALTRAPSNVRQGSFGQPRSKQNSVSSQKPAFLPTFPQIMRTASRLSTRSNRPAATEPPPAPMFSWERDDVESIHSHSSAKDHRGCAALYYRIQRFPLFLRSLIMTLLGCCVFMTPGLVSLILFVGMNHQLLTL